jgi:nucleotide-binding universal stress UspA family protein
MAMFQHILVSTDGSELAQKGVEQGLALAKAFGARATIITVSESMLPYAGTGEVSAMVYQDYATIQKQGADRALETARETAERLGVAAETVWQENVSPADGIVATAEERGCDLIAMASHGRRGLRRLILGSVASEVLARSPVPVLVAR